MARPTTANRCSQETTAIVGNQPVLVVCQKAEAHKGEHQGPVKWRSRGAEAPPGRSA